MDYLCSFYFCLFFSVLSFYHFVSLSVFVCPFAAIMANKDVYWRRIGSHMHFRVSISAKINDLGWPWRVIMHSISKHVRHGVVSYRRLFIFSLSLNLFLCMPALTFRNLNNNQTDIGRRKKNRLHRADSWWQHDSCSFLEIRALANVCCTKELSGTCPRLSATMVISQTGFAVGRLPVPVTVDRSQNIRSISSLKLNLALMRCTKWCN